MTEMVHVIRPSHALVEDVVEVQRGIVGESGSPTGWGEWLVLDKRHTTTTTV